MDEHVTARLIRVSAANLLHATTKRICTFNFNNQKKGEEEEEEKLEGRERENDDDGCVD